jgi:hypothetical protein
VTTDGFGFSPSPLRYLGGVHEWRNRFLIASLCLWCDREAVVIGCVSDDIGLAGLHSTNQTVRGVAAVHLMMHHHYVWRCLLYAADTKTKLLRWLWLVLQVLMSVSSIYTEYVVNLPLPWSEKPYIASVVGLARFVHLSLLTPNPVNEMHIGPCDSQTYFFWDVKELI